MVPLSSVARNWLFYGYYSVCGQVNERTALVGLSMSFAFLRAFYKFALFLTAQRSGIDFINALIAHSLIRASSRARAFGEPAIMPSAHSRQRRCGNRFIFIRLCACAFRLCNISAHSLAADYKVSNSLNW